MFSSFRPFLNMKKGINSRGSRGPSAGRTVVVLEAPSLLTTAVFPPSPRTVSRQANVVCATAVCLGFFHLLKFSGRCFCSTVPRQERRCPRSHRDVQTLARPVGNTSLCDKFTASALCFPKGKVGSGHVWARWRRFHCHNWGHAAGAAGRGNRASKRPPRPRPPHALGTPMLWAPPCHMAPHTLCHRYHGEACTAALLSWRS